MTQFKPITVGLSIIFIIGIVIVLVIGVNKARAGANRVDLSMSKTIEAFCHPTHYRQACVDSLTPLDTDVSATPKDYILLGINAPIDAIKTDINKTEELEKGATSKTDKAAFGVCRKLLGHALGELENALSCIENATLDDMKDKRKVELTNWLNVAVLHEEACLKNIKNETLKDEILDNGLRNSTELSSNILIMVTNLSKILDYLRLEKLGGRRRLLGMD